MSVNLILVSNLIILNACPSSDLTSLTGYDPHIANMVSPQQSLHFC